MSVTNANVAASAGNIYTSSGNTVISTMHFCNVDSTDRTLDLYVVPTGQSITSSRQIYKTLTVPAADTYTITTERFVLGNGDAIAAAASSADKIIATITYASV